MPVDHLQHTCGKGTRRITQVQMVHRGVVEDVNFRAHRQCECLLSQPHECLSFIVKRIFRLLSDMVKRVAGLAQSNSFKPHMLHCILCLYVYVHALQILSFYAGTEPGTGF